MSHWEKPGRSDEWRTPAYVFDALGCEFDLDPCTAAGSWVPSQYVFTKEDDGLNQDWAFYHDRLPFVFMNPPFGGRNSIQPWLYKFFDHGCGIALTPDRTSAPWFQEAWNKADAVLFTRKIKFIRADGTEGTSPSNGTALFACGPKGVDALRLAQLRGLGIFAGLRTP